MEILVFLIVGLVVVMAVVPPIVRDKVSESPLMTTKLFKDSMSQMGLSLEGSQSMSAASNRGMSVIKGSAANHHENRHYTNASLNQERTVDGSSWKGSGANRPDRLSENSPSKRKQKVSAAERRSNLSAILIASIAITSIGVLAFSAKWIIVLNASLCLILAFYFLSFFIISRQRR